eukprot:9261498-Pyramimonas_sp.AAC.1
MSATKVAAVVVQGYILSPLARLVPPVGIFSLPSREWLPPAGIFSLPSRDWFPRADAQGQRGAGAAEDGRGEGGGAVRA